MKMLVLTYSGADPERVSTLLDAAGVPGHTCLEGARGHGLTGPRAGTRAWPGTVTVCFAVMDDAIAATAAARCRSAELPPGERLHVALLPVDSFN
ncbi:MAG: hypothetical protein H6Q77_1837 [Gemmatimonadetes bacterium]|nr:hypothetical protein [Gemmatimonadota bacterium]